MPSETQDTHSGSSVSKASQASGLKTAKLVLTDVQFLLPFAVLLLGIALLCGLK